ncbi:MAG: GDP-mannose 4,6 dehydratase, partial [Blastocatellia bacterium]|nr:GDP-mannose 4,6 dehydratase [Blastocatellia bacterium]
MHVTVTGGAGYIGALLVRELQSGGHTVTVLDRLLHGQDEVATLVEELGATLVRG